MRKLDPKIVAVLILVLLVGVYFFTKSNNQPGPIETYGSLPAESNLEKEKSQPMSARGEAISTQALSQDSSTGGEAQSTSLSIQQLQTWIAAESKNLDQPHIDTKQKDLELKQKIENFSTAEKKLVLETAQNTQRTANERILAAYLLVLDQSKESLENLEGLASKALPDFGPLNAHSEAEIRRGQELAVRYMAIDELVKRASSNAEALDTLKKIANSGESAEIRGYAQRMLKQIK